MESVHDRQVEEVLPYQSEPGIGGKGRDITGESGLESETSVSNSECLARRLIDLNWCKCGQCGLSANVIECFLLS